MAMPLRKEKLLVCEKSGNYPKKKHIYAGLTKKMTASNILLSQRASLGKENKKKAKKETRTANPTHILMCGVVVVVLCFVFCFWQKEYVIPETLPYYLYVDKRKKK